MTQQSEDRKRVKTELMQALFAQTKNNIPTSSLGRLGRTVGAALRGGKFALFSRKKNPDDQVDIEKITGFIQSVGQLKGIAMKMGQIMSYIDVAIPEELQDALSVLQTHAQSMPFSKVETIIHTEFSSQAPLLLNNMDHKPISAASIGQVHKSVLPDGTPVAVKIQYPEVAKAIEADFGPAAVGTKMAGLFYPNAHFDNFIKEAKERFLEECDYLHEAHCGHLFGSLYKKHKTIVVPKVIEQFCSEKVLTTQFIDGSNFDAYLDQNPTQEERDKIGKALFEFYLGSLFRHQIYNCDPHPGNYLFLNDGRIAVLDHGCTRQFEPGFVAKLVNLTRAVHKDDKSTLHHALLAFKMVRQDKPYDFEMIRNFLRSFFGPMLVDNKQPINMDRAIAMSDFAKKKQQLLRFALPGEFMFLFRIRFGLMSVLSRLGSVANWYQLEKKYVDDFAKKHPLLSQG